MRHSYSSMSKCFEICDIETDYGFNQTCRKKRCDWYRCDYKYHSWLLTLTRAVGKFKLSCMNTYQEFWQYTNCVRLASHYPRDSANLITHSQLADCLHHYFQHLASNKIICTNSYVNTRPDFNPEPTGNCYLIKRPKWFHWNFRMPQAGCSHTFRQAVDQIITTPTSVWYSLRFLNQFLFQIPSA